MPNPVPLAVAALGGAAIQGSASRSAARDVRGATEQGISETREARESFERRSDPFRLAGQAAINPLLDLLGISPVETGQQFGQGAGPALTQDQTERQASLNNRISEIDREIDNIANRPVNARSRFLGQASSDLSRERQGILEELNQIQSQAQGPVQGPVQDPLQAQGVEPPIDLAARSQELSARDSGPPLLEEVNPLVSFLRDEGFTDIQEAAAARGELGAGGTLEDLTRFNTNLATTVVPQLQQQKFNQLFNLLGLGSNVAAGQGTAALSSAGSISDLLGQGAKASGANAINQANIATGGIEDLAGILGGANAGGGAGLFNFLNKQNQQVGGIQDPNRLRGHT